ncbi:MAG: 1-acyl-sn-glycerol-3-phosphate acyltransferase [Pyrinomonadaceae bacterium]|nr:1-acyl-sn-glycerol-3-phosphate acyltransferase [Pyrinomonadaceae bacterium]
MNLSEVEKSDIVPLPSNREMKVEPPPMPEWGMALVRFTVRYLSKLLVGIKYFGVEHIPQNRPGGLLICANHQSYFDPFWVCLPVKRQARFMAWDKATRWFIIGNVIRTLGAFPIRIEGGGNKDAFRISLGWLKSGGTLMVFPEGTRSHTDGQMSVFKKGAVRIALEAGVPILPVTIRGANKVWSQDMKTPRLAKVEIEFHPLFELPQLPEGKDFRVHAAEITEQLRQIIASKL